jgi:hypothetical protein
VNIHVPRDQKVVAKSRRIHLAKGDGLDQSLDAGAADRPWRLAPAD